MKSIIPKDSRYLPIVQQKSCCAVACISMIMYKHGIPLMPQELLGYHLGLVVPKKSKNLYWSPRTGRPYSSGYGTQISLKRYHPNTVFPKLKIPLKTIYHPISNFTTEKSFVDFIADKIKKNKDILVCFDHGKLNGNNVHGGHLCVIDRIYPSKGLIRLIDPSPKQPKWRMVKISLLKKAMEFHGDGKSAGLWEFIKTKSV